MSADTNDTSRVSNEGPVFRDGTSSDPSATSALGPDVHLYLSGGTSRSALGGVGLVHALVDGDRWGRVRRIVSVSGGSMLNGALLAGPPGHDPATSHPDDPRPRTNALVHRLVADRLRWWATPVRLASTGSLVLTAIAALYLVVAAFGLVGGPALLTRGGAALLLGLLLPPAVLTVGRWCARAWFTDVVRVVTGSGTSRLSQASGTRQHVFCASGLSSAVPYYFWAGGEVPEIPWGEPIQDDYTVVAAAVASGSLPGLGAVRAPQRFRSEKLVDGGLSGIFGQQIDDTFQRDPDDTFRGDTLKVCLDAGRHNRADSHLLARLGNISLIYTLVRWVKSALEATYVNDVSDWSTGELLRLAADGPSAEPADAVAFGLTSLAVDVGRIGLFNLTPERAAQAIASGYAATSQWIDPATDATTIGDRLVGVDSSLGWGSLCADAWRQATATTQLSGVETS